MKKSSLLLAVMVTALLAGCTAGPSYLSRTVDDWQNNNYEKDPLITSILSQPFIPLYDLGKFVGGVVDVIILNPIQFWGFDVWDNEGAAHIHDNPAGVRDPWFDRWFHEGGE